MKHILPINEWLMISEAYFSEGSSFFKYRAAGLAIMEKLVSQYGYSEQLAAALVGNMFKESTFNPAAGTTYKGLIQWNAQRFGSTPLTVDAQLKLIDKELNGAYLKVKRSAESASSVEAAAEIIARKYEVCADPTHPKRINGAREIYDLYMEKTIPSKLKFVAPEVTHED